MTLQRRFSITGDKRPSGAVRAALCVLTLLCLCAIGLGASLEISTALVCGAEFGGEETEETEDGVEVCTDWQHRIRQCERFERPLDRESARPACIHRDDRVAGSNGAAAPTLAHLIGAGIRLLC